MTATSFEEKKILISQMQIILFSAFPVAIVWTMSWFGVFTFVNTYVIKGLSYSNKDWTGVTLWFVGGMVFWQILCTEISARLGRRLTIFLAMLITSSAFIIIGYLKNLNILGILLFFMGFMPAVFMAVWLPMVAETGENRSGYTLGITQLIGNGIGALTLIIGGWLVSRGNFQKTFIICGAVCCFCSLMFYLIKFFLKEKKHEHIVSLLKIKKTDVIDLVKGPFVWIILAGVCIEPFNFHTANQLFPNLASVVSRK